jgi:hypothetical protein
MPALRWWSVLLLALAVVAGAALWLQRQSAAQLRDELGLLRDENRKLAGLRAENARLVAAQPSAAQLDAMRADHAAVRQLRGEIEKLKADTDRQAHEIERASAPPVPASEWKNAGRATPAATIETMMWAAVRNDVATFASTVGFDPKLRPAVDRFFETLPETTRTRYGTPEQLIAEFMMPELAAMAAGMHIGQETQAANGDTQLIVGLQNRAGVIRESPSTLRHADDGWQVVVSPQAVQQIANRIGSQLAAESKGG